MLLTAVLLWIQIEWRPRQLQTCQAAINQYRLPMGQGGNKPAARRSCGTRWDTDGQTDGH